MKEKGEGKLYGTTVKELFEEAAENLRRAGIEDAPREAEILLCHVLKKDRIYVYAYGNALVAKDDFDAFSLLLSERLSGRPLQYILGKTEFMGLTIEVNSSVLIPRQDTELLAETALAELTCRRKKRKASQPNSENEPPEFEVLDLCTGSGALAIAIAKLSAGANVSASDLSGEALEVAGRNAAAAELPRPIRFFKGNLFAALPPEIAFDMIVSNPPYIASSVVETLEVHVRDHEPRMALDGGADGMDFIKRILAEAPFHLKPNGVLLMEIGYDQGARALALAAAEGSLFAKARILKDLSGNDRVLAAYVK